MNLVLRGPDDRLNRQGIFSLAGRKSNTTLSTKTLKEKVGKGQLLRSELVEELSSLLSLSVSLRSDLPSVCAPVQCPFFVANKATYRGPRGERVP